LTAVSPSSWSNSLVNRLSVVVLCPVAISQLM